MVQFGGDCIVSEDLIVVGEDRMIVNGNCLVDEGRIVHIKVVSCN